MAEAAPVAPVPQTTPPPTTPPASPPTTEAKPGTEQSNQSLLNEKPEVVVPEAYEAFKVPEGYELDADVSKEASTLFKDLGMTQENAQRLVDFYVSKTQEAFEQPYKAYTELREKWRSEISTDKELGGKLATVKTVVARAIDGLGDAKLAADFREAMDITGVGDHPAFIKAFYKLAQKVTEGTHVQGRAPTAPSQERPASAPRTAAHALYPDLP